MRRALLVVAKVIAWVIATVVISGVMVTGCVSGKQHPVGELMPVLLVLTFMAWGTCRDALAGGLVRESAKQGRPRPFRVLVVATVTCLPIAFVFGMLDAALFHAQTGCVSPTFAPFLLLVVLTFHSHACWRWGALPPKMGTCQGPTPDRLPALRDPPG